ncbi:MAG: 2-amino-4-hydroxy-6-hydroxymethyldihydropteridine diphosphokinase [Bdellovibrio sp.]|nr:MAG: 2-amino-4-hydroxy-6-hydroxymethyldihydropteridine diphosphokinase [Bdellovibrio sp.]
MDCEATPWLLYNGTCFGVMNTALFSLKVYSSEEEGLLKKALFKIKDFVQIQKVSSIYLIEGKKDDKRHIHSLRTEAFFKGLCLVVQGQTSLDPEDLLRKFVEVEKELRGEVLYRNLSINLLLFNDVIRMDPVLTLPYPELHLRPEELVPASEISPSYFHPLLKKSLKELSEKYLSSVWGSFYGQGRRLLDF